MKTTTRFVCILVAAVAPLAGCGTSIDFTQTHTPPRPLTPRAPDSVELLTAGAPQRPFVEVGMIEAHQSSAYSLDDRHEVLLKLRESAAKLGCDALVVAGDNGTSTFYAGRGAYGSKTREGYKGTCILYTSPPPAPPAPAPADVVGGT